MAPAQKERNAGRTIPENWREIEGLYDAVMGQDPALRSVVMAELCRGDEVLHRQVESLVNAGACVHGFLEIPALEIAAPWLAEVERESLTGTLAPGEEIGPYRILERLGEGGMGIVYRARDTRLGRDIALKLLPEPVEQNPQALERFKREERAVSALNHPNICTLYDIGEYHGQPFLVLELLEGESLRDRFEGRPAATAELLDVALQIAGALEAAHAKGIVHRDIKPANIFVNTAFQVKILDFGLAKLLSEPERVGAEPTVAAGSSTLATISVMGRAMGTASYMSPEQARGDDVDARSDLFSLGVVLYQLATGARPFQGETPATTVEAILGTDPVPLRQRNPAVSLQLERIILKALHKDREMRYQTAAQLRADLGRLLRSARGARWPFAVAAVLLLVLIVTGFGIRSGWFASTSPMAALPLKRLTSDSGLTTDPALSPDGRLLAYASDRSGEGNLDIWIRQIDGGEPIRLTRDPADGRQPAFSPDGTKIAFRSNREPGGIYIVSTSGGPARLVAAAGERPRFSPDGNWIAYNGNRYSSGTCAGGVGFNIRGRCTVWVVPASGGTPRQVQSDFAAATLPVWSPDGKHLLFVGNRDEKQPPQGNVDWWVTPLDGGPAIQTGAFEVTRRENLGGPIVAYPWVLMAPAWDPGGESLIFSARSGDSTNLWRIAISPKTWKVTGVPERLTSGPTFEESPTVVSGPGRVTRVAFASLAENLDVWSLPIDANLGKVLGRPQQLTRDAASDYQPALSGDHARMAFISSRTGAQEIWLKDLRTSEETALTATRSMKGWPSFSADGVTVGFGVAEGRKWNVYLVHALGGTPEQICDDCGIVTGWSADGTRIIGNDLPGRLWVMDLSSGRIKTMLSISHRLAAGQFSPDERWISYIDCQLPLTSYIAPIEADGSILESRAIRIADGNLRYWSPAGNFVYGWSERDGFLCFWGQRLNPRTKQPVGSPVAVFHSHDPRKSLGNEGEIGISVTRDRLLFSMGERAGNIWMVELKQR